MKNAVNNTIIPTKIIEGLKITIDNHEEEFCVPISTYETALFASIQRGAKVTSNHAVNTAILNQNMTRSVIFQCKDIIEVQKFLKILNNLSTNGINLQDIVNHTSNHCKLLKIESHVVGNISYVRFSYDTCDASGHNMTTIATNEIAKKLVSIANEYNIDVKYISNSGNTCIDKKVSAINSISGRGKSIVADAIISSKTCKEILRTTPEKIIELNTKKNLLGSIVAGSICSGNAHYANMLASVFLPFGQDIANIVEGSQGITFCEMSGEDLYFSVSLPNIICGCIGNGKNIDFVKKNLQSIRCLDENFNLTSKSSERLACLICAVVWCGELSLLSSLTNIDDLSRSHILLERK